MFRVDEQKTSDEIQEALHPAHIPQKEPVEGNGHATETDEGRYDSQDHHACRTHQEEFIGIHIEVWHQKGGQGIEESEIGGLHRVCFRQTRSSKRSRRNRGADVAERTEKENK